MTTTTLNITVKPGSKKGDLITTNTDGSLTVYLRARAVDGAANTALIKLLAKHFGVPKTSIQIAKGHSSRVKVVTVPV